MFSPKITTTCLIGVVVANAAAGSELPELPELAEETDSPIADAPMAAAPSYGGECLAGVQVSAPLLNSESCQGRRHGPRRVTAASSDSAAPAV